ncbi:BTP domain-containing protein [Citrus sinensis]|uniref:Bromodomain associated domain-containing protein n=1 Tax=Citrus sinensis TaxID=2711 RepID=A0A067GPT9_CITSI|nr:transcription initiation factor TFIID subunit 8 [Citrus sinensis]KAH9747471.1 BTP domain-containing protein [Citrus sinensis]KDO77462.1 hypothetical protein CISIN_1g023473mg [Citrus sinensis]
MKSQKTKTKKHQKQNQKPPTEQGEETPSEFAFTVTKVAVSQICRSVGFKAAESSALETLTLVAAKYLQQLASRAASYSHVAHRSESNLVDLTNALNDVSSGQGFPGASALNRNCMLDSGVLKEIAGFVRHGCEIPFAKPIPRSKNAHANSVCCKKENDRGSRSLHLHIPKWLPAFPDERSYNKECQGPVCNRSEKLWENSEFPEGERFTFGGYKWEVLGGDLAKEREKVRFKIGVKGNNGVGFGVDLRNGVCRGGKRVRWNVGDVIDDGQNCLFKPKRSLS